MPTKAWRWPVVRGVNYTKTGLAVLIILALVCRATTSLVKYLNLHCPSPATTTLLPMLRPSSMHRCLNIVELQSQIFEYCAHFGLKSVAVLAQTCRAFHESALEILWRELEDISPFIKMLPSHLWREVKTVNKSGQTITTLVSEHRMMT